MHMYLSQNNACKLNSYPYLLDKKLSTYRRKRFFFFFFFSEIELTHRIGCNLKLLRESTNADRRLLKIAFSIAYCRFRLPICNLKRCFKAYRLALLDSRDSSRLPPIRCSKIPSAINLKVIFTFRYFHWCVV